MGLGLGKLISDTFLSKGLDIVKKLVKDKDQAEQLEHEFRALAATQEHDIDIKLIEDRQDARDMYKEDDDMQKAFALTFLVGYIVITFTFLFGIYQSQINSIEYSDGMIALVTMIFTALSTKINTIVDFFFGGSKK